jgi:hypothetical protein
LHTVLAVCIFLRLAETLVYSLAAFVFGIYALAQGFALINGMAIDCGCFGYTQTVISWRSAVVPIVLAVLSTALAIISARTVAADIVVKSNRHSNVPLAAVGPN